MKENQDPVWERSLTHRVRQSNWNLVFTAGCRTTPITHRVRRALCPVPSVVPAQEPDRSCPETTSEPSTSYPNPNELSD